MRIACLQFAPQVGDVDNNLNRADAVLSRADPQDLDLLVLPELAFSGYNFESLQDISPYLEYTASGITSLWARSTALKYECVVTAGYPEKVRISGGRPASSEYYNSAITVNADGDTIVNYRKTFLYYRDEIWASEGSDGFHSSDIPGLGNVAMGICMDLNPYKFETPWTDWEFAYHILHQQANLVIISMAWLTQQDLTAYSRRSKEPDIDILSYWVSRLEPVIRAEDVGEVIVVLANRCGTEGKAIYAGTSCVLGINAGEVKVYGILGRGERELLVVNTMDPPQFKLVAETRGVTPMDAMPSCNALMVHCPHEQVQPLPLPPIRGPRMGTPFPSDIRPQGREALVTSIDAALSDKFAVSPITTTSSLAFFSAGPPQAEDRLENIWSSIPASPIQNPATSIASLIQLHVPILKDPIPPRARASYAETSRSWRSNGNEDLGRRAERRSERGLGTSSGRPFDMSLTHPKLLEVPRNPSTSHWNAEYTDQLPESASSMTVNTPWESSPILFRADEIIRIIKHMEQPPDSASSMRVNTPWESSPALFRAEEIIKIIKSLAPSSPQIKASPSIKRSFPPEARYEGNRKSLIPRMPLASGIKPLASGIKLSSLPTVPIVIINSATGIVSSSKYAWPPLVPLFASRADRIQSRKLRNNGQPRTQRGESALTKQDLTQEPAIVSIAAAVEDVVPAQLVKLQATH